MGEHRPQTVLERVARLEIENARLEARIARIRAHDANADTVSTRRPRTRGGRAWTVGVALTFCGTLFGMAIGFATSRSSHATSAASEPPPAIDPLPPTPPVYAVPPPRVGNLHVSSGSQR